MTKGIFSLNTVVALVYAFTGSAIVSYVGYLTGSGSAYRLLSPHTSLVYATVALLPVLVFLSRQIVSLIPQTIAYFVSVALSVLSAMLGAMLFVGVMFITYAFLPFFSELACASEHCTSLTVLTLIAASLMGGLAIFAPLKLFSQQKPDTFFSTRCWIYFCILYPLAILPFIDLTVLESFFDMSGSRTRPGVAFVNHLTFLWQVGTLYMLWSHFAALTVCGAVSAPTDTMVDRASPN